ACVHDGARGPIVNLGVALLGGALLGRTSGKQDCSVGEDRSSVVGARAQSGNLNGGRREMRRSFVTRLRGRFGEHGRSDVSAVREFEDALHRDWFAVELSGFEMPGFDDE